MRAVRSSLCALRGLLAGASIVLARCASAFESDEHEKLANVAFLVALEYLAKTSAITAAKYEEASRLKGTPGKYRAKGDEKYRGISYGDIVACVDYYLYPETILADSWKQGRRPPEAGALPKPTEALVDLKDCHGIGSSFFQATHNNHSHFQYDLLMSQRVYHALAISLARDEGALFAALVVSAISDHYLHDFFAPGHIFTGRARLTDLPATALHDVVNARGAEFVPANFAQLQPIMEFICQGAVERCVARRDLSLWEVIRDASDREVADSLGALLAGQTMDLKGDGQLWDEGPDRLRQRLLMLLIQVRSIADVVSGRNSFQDMAWEGRAPPTKAKIAFGEYALPKAAASAKRPAQAEWMQNPGAFLRNPIVAISAQREAMIAGTRAGRTTVTLEVPLTIFPSERFIVLPYLGYGTYSEGNTNGQGFTFRAVAAIPQTELAFGPYVRYFSYPTNEGDKLRGSVGLRLDSGFSGYFTTFIAVGRDTSTTADGKLRAGVITFAGIQFGFPMSRLHRLR